MALAHSEALVERFHGEFKYKCVKCDLTRNSNSHMKNHRHRKHVRLKYLCHQCTFTVKLNQILIKHFKNQLVQVWKKCCCLNCVSSSQHEGFNETGNIRGDLQVKITFLYRNGIPSLLISLFLFLMSSSSPSLSWVFLGVSTSGLGEHKSQETVSGKWNFIEKLSVEQKVTLKFYFWNLYLNTWPLYNQC